MPEVVLTVLKLVLLGLLYLFLARTVRAVTADLYGPRRKRKSSAPPRPAVASPSPRKSRKTPREIVVHPPNGQPHVVELRDAEVTLGRSHEMTVTVQDVYASDEHAVLEPDEDGWVVRDLGSTNGTYLNGAKVTRPTPVMSGDQLRVGKTRVEVRR